jgi:hypothetical protein
MTPHPKFLRGRSFCENCAAFNEDEDLCQRFAPKPARVYAVFPGTGLGKDEMDPIYTADPTGDAYFPSTLAGSWCAEWIPTADAAGPSLWRQFNETLSVRARNALDMGNIRSFEEFDKLPDYGLKQMRGVGTTTHDEIIRKRALFPPSSGLPQ